LTNTVESRTLVGL